MPLTIILKQNKADSKSKWNFHKDGITQGFLNSWLQCRKQTHLNYVEGWTPIKVSDAFEFGHCFHYCLSRAYTEPSIPLPGMCRSYVKEYEELQEKQRPKNIFVSNEDYQKWETMYGIVERMLSIYTQRYKDDWSYNWLQTEETFKEDYWFKHREHKISTFLQGRIDGVYKRKRKKPDGQYFFETRLIDHKCLSQIPEGFKYQLPFDIQINFYILAAQFATNERIEGLDYNIIRRPQTRRKKDQTLLDYLDEIDFKVRDDPSHYFQRIPILYNQVEIYDWAAEVLHPILSQIYIWYLNDFKPTFVNPNALITKYGKSFYYDAITQNNFRSLYRRQIPFPELIDNDGSVD